MDAKIILKQLIDECGGVKAFADRVGLSESMIFHVLSGRRQFGKKAAKKIEDAFPGRVLARDLVWIEAA